MNEVEIRFELNGEARRAAVAPELLLADFLRRSLGLKGTKTSCEVEVCGACTVLLDGCPVSSCATLAREIDGRSLVTIEGLGSRDALHPVQEAFWEEGGFECGFCTPGMILSACALLDENPDPSEAAIKAALDGNVCRCTGYVSIVRSVRRAAELLRGQGAGASAADERRLDDAAKGAPARREAPRRGAADARRLDGSAKVRGAPVYTADLTRPDMLHGRVLRSPHAHARVLGIDTAAAESHPGVAAVLTAADLQDISPYYGPLVKDIPVLAMDKVRYEGDPVAAVAAETPEAAAAALGLIRVEYEPLPALLTLDAALDPGAPPLHEFVSDHGAKYPGYPDVDDEAGKYANVSFHYERSKGNVEDGFAASARVFEHTFEFPKVAHHSMEPQLALAEWRDDGVTVWASTQHPFIIRQELAEMFGLPRERVRLVVPLVGGTYGNKNHTKLEPLAVALARKARRPVFLHLSLEEESRTVSKPAMRVRLRTGVDREGRLLARDCLVHVDGGAYSDSGPRVTQKAGYRAPGPYRIPHLRSHAYTVYTNTVPAGAFRGMGTPQVVWAYESQMDIIAREMGWDPVSSGSGTSFGRAKPSRRGRRPSTATWPRGCCGPPGKSAGAMRIPTRTAASASVAGSRTAAGTTRSRVRGWRSTTPDGSPCTKAPWRSGRDPTPPSPGSRRTSSACRRPRCEWRRWTRTRPPSTWGPTPAAEPRSWASRSRRPRRRPDGNSWTRPVR